MTASAYRVSTLVSPRVQCPPTWARAFLKYLRPPPPPRISLAVVCQIPGSVLLLPPSGTWLSLLWQTYPANLWHLCTQQALPSPNLPNRSFLNEKGGADLVNNSAQCLWRAISPTSALSWQSSCDDGQLTDCDARVKLVAARAPRASELVDALGCPSILVFVCSLLVHSSES